MGKHLTIDSTQLTVEQINFINQRIAYLETQDLLMVAEDIKLRINLGVIKESDISIINKLLSLKSQFYIGPYKIF